MNNLAAPREKNKKIELLCFCFLERFQTDENVEWKYQNLYSPFYIFLMNYK